MLRFVERVRAEVAKRRLHRSLERQGITLLGPVRSSGRRPINHNQGSITLASGVHLRGAPQPVRFSVTRSGRITLGANVFVNTGVIIYSCREIEVGADTKIADDCAIYDTNFHPVHEGHLATSKPVRIGRNVWLGRGVVVLPGTTIGDHSVIGANSVVSGYVPAREIWKGNPAGRCGEVHASDSYRRP
jgi:acetyltransferase-like isoleucine patch superfamily enzyme